MGYIRLMCGYDKAIDNMTSYLYSLIYLVLVIDTCVFTVMYIKRTLIMAFLTMIAPLIAVTYPLDKMKDGKAQAFGMWIKEYTFNALIQPLHLIIYTMLISTAMGLAKEHPIYALVALGFIIPAEKFLRKMFGFEKASTLSPMGAMAGGALVFSGIKKLAGLGRGKKEEKEEKEQEVRTTDKDGVKLPNIKENGGADLPEQVTQQQDETILDNTEERARDKKRERQKFTSPVQNNNQKSQETSETILSEPISRKHSITAGMRRLGNRYRKKNLKSKPMKKMGKFVAMGIGGTTLGIVGLAAGISSGSGSKALAYTAGGFGVGAKVGGNLSDRAWDEAGRAKEAFSKGYFGEDEYNNRKLDYEFFQSDEYLDILDDNTIFGNLKGTERKKKIKDTLHVYRSSGLTDISKTKLALHVQDNKGLDAKQTMWAYQLAQNFSRSDWNDPKKREHYEQEARSRLGADYSNKILGAMEQFLE